jgi:hypothetical protein
MCGNDNWLIQDIKSQHQQILSEKLSQVLGRLNSICEQYELHKNSEQFILGVKESTRVICEEFTLNFSENTTSISDLDQIPLPLEW